MIPVIIPVYNESRRIGHSLESIAAKASRFKEYEFIIADDCSSDGTLQIAKGVANGLNGKVSMRVVTSAKRLGKGATLARVIDSLGPSDGSQGDFVVFLDVDLPNNVADIPLLIKELENGYDIVVGSRYLPGSNAKRPFGRDAMSIVYNAILALAFGSKIKDHQCGFKAFRKSSVSSLFNSIKDRKWFWDSELLVKAQKKGLRVREVPIHWEETQEGNIAMPYLLANMACGMSNLFLDIYLKVNGDKHA